MGSDKDVEVTEARSQQKTSIDKPSGNGILASQEQRHSDDDVLSVHSIHSEAETTHDDSRRDMEAALYRIKTPKQALIKVPKKERRGWFATFSFTPEVTNPYDYHDRTKWFVTFIVSISGAAAPIGSSIIFPTLEQVTKEMNTTPTVTNLTVALYMLSMGIFPLWWSAFSEASGRRSVYIASFALFVVFAILSALATSIEMLIVTRMLVGGAAASVQSVGAGTISDIWESSERGRAMGIFYLGPLCGPLFAPILGGIVGERWNWRATQWVLAIIGALTWLLVFFGLPETLRATTDLHAATADPPQQEGTELRPTLSRTSTRESVHRRSKQYARIAKMVFINPLTIFSYIRYPAVALTIYYASVTFGSLYVLNISITYSFERPPYDFTTLIIGLLYLPNSLGYILASLLGGRWMDYIMKREAIKANRIREGKLVYQPEDRMRENAWLAAVLYPCALLWYGWTVEKGVFWLVPMIANFFYGIGSMTVFALATTMLTEFMPQRTSSGVALNNFFRNIFSAVGGIVGAPLISSIGNGWLFTILGIWTLSSAVVIWAMRKFGPRWRIRMEEDLG